MNVDIPTQCPEDTECQLTVW